MCPIGDGGCKGFGPGKFTHLEKQKKELSSLKKTKTFLFGRAIEMAQWAKELAAKSHVVTLSPATHMMEGESQLPQVALRYPLAHPDILMHTHPRARTYTNRQAIF